MSEAQFLTDVLILLLAAVVVVGVFSFARLDPLLGYIVAGVVIGPHGLGLIAEVGETRALAELGIVFLMFMIGMELSFARLKAMRHLVFGLGLAQVAISAVAIGGIALWMGGTADAALVIGVALALSSTALGLQLVIQRNEQATQLGRTALSILLFQDLVVVPLLVLVPLLGDEVGTLLGKIGMASFKAGVALLIIVVLGRLLLKRLFHWIARSGGTELVTATALLVILGTAAFTQLAGLSLTLGAFLAGLLIAETEYRHQVAADINPFRGLLLGLFFMTVGMSIDLGFLVYEVRLILISVAALMVIKGVILYGLGRLFGVAGPVAIRAAFLLAQGGEFAFILFGMAQFHGVIDNATVQVLLAMVAVSMALTPASAAAGRALAGLMVNRRVADTSVLEHEAERLDGHVVIAGFGRVGQTVGRMLAAQGIPYIALDLSPQRVRDGRLGGLPVFYGDSSRPNLLRAAGVERALAAVVTLDKPEASQRAVAVLRRSNPGLLIYARAHDAAAMDRLDRAGASVVVPETLEASLQLGGQVLRCTGMTEADIDRLFATFREEHYGRLADVIPAKGNAGEEPPDR